MNELKKKELSIKLLEMRQVAMSFELSAKSYGVDNFSAFKPLMDAYFSICQQLLDQGVDFSALPEKCFVGLASYSIDAINQSMNKVFPGHFLMIGVPPRELFESKCPGCKMGMEVTIQHPAYLVRCATVTCPVRPAQLLVPLMNLSIPLDLKVKGR